MAKIKGTAFKSTVMFFKKHLGEEGYLELIKEMPPEEASILESSILVSGWYEFSLLRKLMKKAEGKVIVPPGRTIAWELGRYSADAAVTTVYKIFFKLAEPAYIIKKSFSLFPAYYDSGALELVTMENRKAIMRLKNFNEPSPEFCGRIQGWMQRIMELTGRKNVIIFHPSCRVKGAPYCEYHGRWD